MMRPRITIHKGIRMLVAVDIGNTNIVLGFLDGDDIIGTYRITTKSNHTSDEYGLMITQFLALSGLRPSDIDDVIIASVVPKVMHSFRASIIKFLNINPMVVGPGIKTGINIRIDDPKSLGSDCLADCVGAYYTYGGPVLVADFGTATTFNYVNDEGVITCGLITTGIRTAAAALWGETAQLPEVEITASEGEKRRFDPERFHIESAPDLNGNVLLLDDSWVTGANVQSVAACLKTAGAEQVSIYCVARIVNYNYLESLSPDAVALFQKNVHYAGGFCPWNRTSEATDG